jgi:hypothetical protein
MSDEFIEIKAKWERDIRKEKSRADRAEKELASLKRKLGKLYRDLVKNWGSPAYDHGDLIQYFVYPALAEFENEGKRIHSIPTPPVAADIKANV